MSNYQKYLKYKIKYLELKNFIQKGGFDFDTIESKLDLDKKKVSKPMEEKDIIHLQNASGKPIIQCKICNKISGAWISEFTHNKTCKYWIDMSIERIAYQSPDLILKTSIVDNSIFPVYKKEAFIATTYYPIIGTYDLIRSICIIMRDPTTTKTMLAHIDISTINPIDLFMKTFIDSSRVDLYIVGGDETDLETPLKLIRILKQNNKFNIKLVWLIDSHTNDVSIDSRNGDVYLNLEFYMDPFYKFNPPTNPSKLSKHSIIHILPKDDKDISIKFMNIPRRLSIAETWDTRELYIINT
jgi:hypothetical protein